MALLLTAIIIILILLIWLMVSADGNLQEKYKILEDEHKKLQSKYETQKFELKKYKDEDTKRNKDLAKEFLTDTAYWMKRSFENTKKYNELQQEYKKLQLQINNKEIGIKDRENLELIETCNTQKKEIKELQFQIKKKSHEIEILNIEKEAILKEKCTDKLYNLANKIAEKELADFDNLAVRLEFKNSPAYKSAQKVRMVKQQAKEFEVKYRMMKYEYDMLFELFPELENYIEYGNGEEELATVQKYFDRTSNWLSKDEYDRLNESQRNQLALDRYIEKYSKSKWQSGRDYEMSIAHKFKEQGYNVDYVGIQEKLNDKGRDIIAQKGNEILIIQCKYWSKEKVIHEKHICQLYGTAIMYKKEHHTNKKVIPVFVTQTSLSDTAREFAKYLGVRVLENEPLKEFPRIKCNINKGEKIYHLPFDQQYDVTKIDTKKGESFEFTVAQAELKGFRRARKWIYP